MSKPENSFIKGVHTYLPDECYRMKNHNAYTGGVFDCWYSGLGKDSGDLWVEYKFIVLPKRPDTLIVPELSKLQLEWGRGRFDERRSVWVIVGCKEGGVIFKTPKAWSQATSCTDFKSSLLSRRDLAETITNFCMPSIIPKVTHPESTSHQRSPPCASTKQDSSKPWKQPSRPPKNLSTATPSSTDLRSVNTRRRRIESPTT